MRLWSRARQWKRSADEALAPAHFARQRDRLTTEVCERVGVIRIVQGHGTADELSVRIQKVVVGTLDNAMVQSSLGLKYLDALDESLRQASYEDAPELLAEMQWAKEYVRLKAPCLLESAITTQGGDRFWEPQGRMERLFHALTLLAVAELSDGELAA